MPIRPEFRQFYGRAWRQTRVLILERAGARFEAGKYIYPAACEQCGKPDRTRVWVYSSPSGNGQYWSALKGAGQSWHYCAQGGAKGNFALIGPTQWKLYARHVLTILTVAHLNHTPGDDRPENLKALCQWCHLNYDKLHHHQTRATRKDATRPLLQEAS